MKGKSSKNEEIQGGKEESREVEAKRFGEKREN